MLLADFTIYVPSPWLMRIRFMQISLTQLFKRNPSLNTNYDTYPLLISPGFLKYPLELKEKSVRMEKKNHLVYN